MGLNISAGITSLKCPRWIISVLKGFLINCEAVSICCYSGSVQKEGKPMLQRACSVCSSPVRNCPSPMLEAATPTAVCGRKTWTFGHQRLHTKARSRTVKAVRFAPLLETQTLMLPTLPLHFTEHKNPSVAFLETFFLCNWRQNTLNIWSPVTMMRGSRLINNPLTSFFFLDKIDHKNTHKPLSYRTQKFYPSRIL